MQIQIGNHWRGGRFSLHVVLLASFAMLTAALCCAASVLGDGGAGDVSALAPSVVMEPCVANYNDAGAEQQLGMHPPGGWREERIAAMIERMDKCAAGPQESSSPTCLVQNR